AIRNMPGGQEIVQAARGPQIMADAAHAVLTGGNLAGTHVGTAGAPSGNFYTDEEVLRAAGVSDFRPYSLGAAEEQLVPDIFL
ncbi:MAG TPA: short chain dehydrogenase, partial [Arthrobacter bacterium]|nr:short chain dehydrogenase [Arthrobacter sp.]